jgi:RNA polymerase sigma factor (sigma-70 family)
VKHLAQHRSEGGLVVEPDQTAARAVAFPVPQVWPPSPPAGFEDFFRASFREVVRAAMYAGATQQEAEDAAEQALEEMLRDWGIRERSLAYARKAAVHNFIKAKTRGSGRVARRLVGRGHVPWREGAQDRQLTALEDEQWVAWVLSSLPPAQREVMALIAKGLDRDEIAGELGKSKQTIRRHLCDARARLALMLNPDGEPRQDPAGEHRQQPPRRTARTPGRRPDDHQ